MDDHPDGLTARERDTWFAASDTVRKLVFGKDKRVLVTCFAGLNRSGIVVAQALKCAGHSPEKAITLVRAARGPHALGNRAFVDALLGYRINGQQPGVTRL